MSNVKAQKQLHPIAPFYDKSSRVLILGSFPSVKSREQMFFYAHPQNRFWRVLAAVFGGKAPESIEEKKLLLKNNRVALWDVIASCEISGSSDGSISDVAVNDVSIILQGSQVDKIFTNGKTAHRYFELYIADAVGMHAQCLPSTSSANAAWSLPKLISAWSVIG